MKEKTLEDFKNEVAKQYFASNLNLVPKSNIWLHFRSEVGCHDLVYALESAAENYANHVKAIALQEGKKDLLEIQKWSDKYEFSFQFWGMGNNNVFVEKDGTELYSTGGHETPELAIKDALNYVNKINP